MLNQNFMTSHDDIKITKLIFDKNDFMRDIRFQIWNERAAQFNSF